MEISAPDLPKLKKSRRTSTVALAIVIVVAILGVLLFIGQQINTPDNELSCPSLATEYLENNQWRFDFTIVNPAIQDRSCQVICTVIIDNQSYTNSMMIDMSGLYSYQGYLVVNAPGPHPRAEITCNIIRM